MELTLGQIVGELIAALIGDAVLAALFPQWSQAEPPPAEGMWNASLGSVAAFLAALAAMFCGLSSFFIIAHGLFDPVIGLFLLVSVIAALAAAVLAKRTFQVTERRHTLARMGLWLSRATVTVAVVAVAFSTFGITLGVR